MLIPDTVRHLKTAVNPLPLTRLLLLLLPLPALPTGHERNEYGMVGDTFPTGIDRTAPEVAPDSLPSSGLLMLLQLMCYHW